MVFVLKRLALIALLSSAVLISAKLHKQLIVGVNNEFPPYEYLDQKNHIVGSNIDILKAVSKDSGIHFKLDCSEWGIIRSKFDKGEVQMLSGLCKTPLREKKYLFTIPYSYVHYSVFIRHESQPLNDWNDLNGKQVLVESGNVIEEILKERGLSVKVLYTPSFQDALEKLSIGVGDAVIMPKIQAYQYIAGYHWDNLTEVNKLSEALPYCFALPLGNEELRSKLNQSLFKLNDNYQLRISQNKWLGIIGADMMTLDRHTKYYRFLLVLVVLGLLGIGLVIVTLVKRIRQQKSYLAMQIAERNNYEKEFNQRHKLFVTGPIIFLKWNDTKREMFDSLSGNFAVFGYDPNDILSGKIQYRSIIHPEDLEWILQQRQQHLDRHEYIYYQIYRIICPITDDDDASTNVVNTWHDRNCALANVNTVQIRWVFDYTVILPDEVSSAYHFYGYLLDITKQKIFETELFQQHGAAQVAINTKDIFLTSISVEINSPLNALIGLARKVSEKSLSEEQKSALHTITDSALHLKQILQQIHDFLNILKGSIGSIPQWYVLKSLIEPIISEFQFKIAGKQLAFEHNEFQPSALVFLDSDWFQKIVRIALDNAVKFTQEGKIELTVDLVQLGSNKGELLVKIADTGVGIPAEKLQLIMEPFTQADETYTRRFGGIGLGLSIARNLLIQMNGIIHIVSEPKQGTSVELRFPVETQ
jgi:signal transduction histidine kinase/ABC-type amino acid transport substrate-binding protein